MLLFLASLGCAPRPVPLTSPPAPAFPGLSAEVCLTPNPARGAITATATAERADDGSFEAGVARWRVEGPTAERLATAAHTGGFGLRVIATEAGTVALPLRLDKNTRVDVSVWVRASAPVALGLIGEPPPRFEDGRPMAEPAELATARVGPGDWTAVSLTLEPSPNAALHYLRLTLPAGTTLDLDDVSARASALSSPPPPEGARVVGGIAVPPAPLAPVLFAVMIHVEDIPAFRTNRSYLRRKAWLIEAVAERVAARGGQLVVQPGLSFVAGAEAFAPGLLRRWTERLGVAWSTHSHGPDCRDDQGVLQPPTACRKNPSWSRDITSDDVLAYLAPQRDALYAAVGVMPLDHNGNFDMDHPGALAQAGIRTMTAYKNPRTQRGFDTLYTNPWRPAGGQRDGDTAALVTHDPTAGIVYLPGLSPDKTRWWDRLGDAWAPELAGRIGLADPARVNTAYTVLHVDHFTPLDGTVDAWLGYDEATDVVTPSAALLGDLTAFEAALDARIVPLVNEGYLTWSTPDAMGRAYAAWETACGGLGGR